MDIKRGKKVMLFASLLGADILELKNEVKRIERFVDGLHIDIMDGQYVPNITFGFKTIELLKKNFQLFIDVHLMVKNPLDTVERVINYRPDSISFHIETAEKPEEIIKIIKGEKIAAGIAINANVDERTAFDCLNYVDFVLVMGVNAGLGAQRFIPNTLNKIKNIKDEIAKKALNVAIAVDGGINEENSAKCINAGANIIISGHALFSSKDIQKTAERVRGIK